VLQHLVGGELDLLVTPLGGAVDAGDERTAVNPSQVAENDA